MGLEKIGINLAQKTASWVKAAGKTGILQTKPINPVKLDGLHYSHNLTCDTVSLASKRCQEINKAADDTLSQLRRNYNAEYIERNLPEVVENVKAGKIEVADELEYFYYKQLETFRREFPEKFVLLGSEKGSASDLMKMMEGYGTASIQTAKEMPIADIRKVFSEVDNLKFKPQIEHYMNMLIMKKYNPKTYEYMMSNQRDLVIEWGSSFGCTPSSSMLKKITPEQIQVMRKDSLTGIKQLGLYVESSDRFANNPTAVKELSEALSKYKISTDVNLYRGDKTVGMFDSIVVDKNLEKQIRQLLETNKQKAQNTKITEYTGRYNCSPTTNLYDFLSSKETLTLADAMQVAKYGDDAFLKEVVNRIQNSRIVDTRFKSYSFDKGMASGWKSRNAGGNTTILQNALVKKGTQGGYKPDNNGQFEVILNNAPKEMTFPKVTYNKKTDTFELNTVVQNILDNN